MGATCPEPETMARLAEGLADESERETIIEHASDCVACRRHLAIASMPPLPEPRVEPARPGRVLGALWSLAAAGLAAAAIGYAVAQMWPASAPSPVVKRTEEAAPPEEDVVRTPEERREIPLLPRKPRKPPRPAPPRPKEPRVDAPAMEPEPPAEPAPEEPPIMEPEAPAPAPPRETVAAEWKPLDPGERSRVALRDSFGPLALREKGAAASSALEGAHVLPADAVVLAGNRAAGGTLGDGTRVQLAVGASASVFRSGSLACVAVRLEQGAMIVDMPESARTLFVARGESTVLVEGVVGPVLLNAGPRANIVELAPLKGTVACRVGATERAEASTSDVLVVEKGQTRRAARNGRVKEALGRFVAWPDRPASLLFLCFEPDQPESVEVERGARHDGYLSGVKSDRRKVIQLALPARIPQDAQALRVRFRTPAPRIVVSSVPLRELVAETPLHTIAVPSRDRSERAWAEASIVFDAQYTQSWKALEARWLVFYVDVPGRDVDGFVFDIDEVELSRKR